MQDVVLLVDCDDDVQLLEPFDVLICRVAQGDTSPIVRGPAFSAGSVSAAPAGSTFDAALGSTFAGEAEGGDGGEEERPRVTDECVLPSDSE